jgi:hypothetical protein
MVSQFLWYSFEYRYLRFKVESGNPWSDLVGSTNHCVVC